MDEHSPPTKRTKNSFEDFTSLNKDELIEKYQKQQQYIEELECKINNNSYENDEKEKTSALQSTRRENVLVMRLATKEQEVQECIRQIDHIKKVQDDGALLSLRQANLDPGVNLLFGKMREELQQTKDKLEQAQSELSAWKFTPDSQNGKKLISRCRTLIAENQELGRQLSQGKSAQLEAELALQKKYSEELKVSQDELNEFVIQLDEEVEAMQSTIQVLQQQLAATRRDCVKNKEIVHQCKEEEQMKREDREEASGSVTYEEVRASLSEPDDAPSISGDEYKVLSYDRHSTSPSTSYEEGEYVSGCEMDYDNDNASVTDYNVDEYEILETVPSETDENQNNDSRSPGTPIHDLENNVDVKSTQETTNSVGNRPNCTPPASPSMKNHKLSADAARKSVDRLKTTVTSSKHDDSSSFASRSNTKKTKKRDNHVTNGPVPVKSQHTKKHSAAEQGKSTNSKQGSDYMILDQTYSLNSTSKRSGKSDSADHRGPNGTLNVKGDAIHTSSKRRTSSSLRNHSKEVRNDEISD